MDNLIVFVPFILGLTLFSVLYAAERLSARRYRRRINQRLEILRRPNLKAQSISMPYSLTYPRIPKPYQRRLP